MTACRMPIAAMALTLCARLPRIFSFVKPSYASPASKWFFFTNASVGWLLAKEESTYMTLHDLQTASRKMLLVLSFLDISSPSSFNAKIPPASQQTGSQNLPNTFPFFWVTVPVAHYLESFMSRPEFTRFRGLNILAVAWYPLIWKGWVYSSKLSGLQSLWMQRALSVFHMFHIYQYFP